jgi:C-terminal processing protease CtpA/Prc
MKTATAQRNHPASPIQPPLAALGHGVTRVARLAGRAGYIALSEFGAGVAARHALASAFRRVADAPAIILDLRAHRGGDATTAALITSYLFATEPMARERFASCPGAATRGRTVPRLPTATIDVLVSRETSALGRAFAANLARLGRAHVVGPGPARWAAR